MEIREGTFLLALTCMCLVLSARADTSSGQNSGQIPVGVDYDDDMDPLEVEGGVNFLKVYGYLLKDGNTKVPKTRTPAEYKLAISRMQEYANIPVTGILDNRTVEQMKKPRCGLPDILEEKDMRRRRKKRYQLAGSKWGKKDLTYRIVNYTPDLSRSAVDDAIAKALNSWGEHTPLSFRASNTRTADIQIKFARGNHGDGYPFDGRGGTLAHAYFPGSGIGGDAHFDDGEWFTHGSVAGTNLFLVAAHELGHSLGLGHSDVETALMAPYYQGYQSGSIIKPDDVRGIQRLYGRAPPKTDPVRPPQRPPVRPQDPPQGPENPNGPALRPECNQEFTATTFVSPHLYVFRDRKVWQVHQNGQISPGFPKRVSALFSGFDQRVDAIYRKPDGTAVVFSGNQYFEYLGRELQSGPRSVRSLGLGVDRIDAAVVWDRNGKTYFFAGDQYWRYDEMRRRPDSGYPRPIQGNWRGMPDSPSSAFANGQGKTFFLKGKQYHRFDDQNVRRDNGYPRYFTVDFLKCETGSVFGRTGTEEGIVNSSTILRAPSIYVTLLTALLSMFLVLFKCQ